MPRSTSQVSPCILSARREEWTASRLKEDPAAEAFRGFPWLLATVLLAAARRLARLGQIFVFPDEVLWAYFPLKLHTHPLFTANLLDNPLAQLARWNYGYFYVALLYVYTGLLSALGIPITEAGLV